MSDQEKTKLIHLNKDLFLEKIVDYENNPSVWKYLGNRPAIIDFYAEWCGPCKAVGPVLDELAQEYADKLDIYKIDVDKEQELAGMFGITSVPTILFIPMEDNPQMAVGAMSKEGFIQAINDVLL